MKKISALALATIIGATGFAAAPAFAAPGSVPFCNTGAEADLTRAQQDLATDLKLATKPFHSVEVWNGCLKVVATDSTGHSTTSFYDPDTLNFIGDLS